MPPSPSIYAYLDYREYLRDYYAARKAHTRYFSHRYFCRKAGFKTSNVLELVMKGKRNLSRTGILKFARALDLNGRERDYFETIVLYGQANDSEAKREYLARLMKLRRKADVMTVGPERYAFYGAWWHTLVREMVGLSGFDGTAEWISRHSVFPVSAARVRESLALLERLGLVRKDVDGRWRPSQAALDTGTEVNSTLVAEFNREMIRRGLDASVRLPRTQREISGVTLRTSRACFERFKRRLQELKRELLEAAVLEEDGEAVYQLNVQFFPLTKE